MSIIKIRTHVLVILMALALGLTACGGGGEDGPSYALRIEGPEAVTTNQQTFSFFGDGFLPPGSTCPASPPCSAFGLSAVPVFGHLGPYTLTWTNAATGESGKAGMSWICGNCGGSAPYWVILNVPLAPGENRITVSMIAGPYQQEEEIVVTRQ